MSNFIQALLICTVSMSCVAAALLALSPLLLARYSAKSVYVAWIIVLIGFIIPFRPQIAPAMVTVPVAQIDKVSFPFAWQGNGNAQTGRQNAQNPPTEPQASAQAQADLRNAETSGMPLLSPKSTQDTSARSSLTISFPLLITLLWLAGTLATLYYRLLAHHQFMKVVRRWQKPVTNPAYLHLFTVTMRQLGIQKPIGLMKCKPIDTPMLVGLWKPCILLPDDDIALSALQLVLRHELIHYKRRDLAGKILMLIASAMHWFNPLMRFVSNALSFQCEASCDAEVMKGTNLETRQYYSETILHMVRRHQNISTALSTCYRGSKKTMKKRIMEIMNMQRKKLGHLVVAILSIAILCGGMTIALGATLSWDLTQEILQRQAKEEYYVNGDPDSRRDICEMQARLSAMIDTYRAEIEAVDPTLLNACVKNNTFNNIDLDKLEALLADCQSAEALIEILQSTYVQVYEDLSTIDAYISEVLEAAGHVEMPYRVYKQHDGSMLLGRLPSAPENIPVWTIYAAGEPDPQTGKRPTAYLYMLGDYKTSQFLTVPTGYTGTPRSMTAKEREYARDRAVSFSETYALSMVESFGSVLVSDRVFEGEIPEPFTYVWIENAAPWPYEDNFEQDIIGMELTVGLDTGCIYSIRQSVALSGFVNAAQAGQDWKALTGREYPYFSSMNLFNSVLPWIEDKLNDLYYQHWEALSPQNRVDVLNLLRLRGNGIPSDGEWQQFVIDLDACVSADDFVALLNRGYAGVNNVIGDTAAQKELEAEVDRLLNAFGYADYAYRSIRYAGFDDNLLYVVYATNLEADQQFSSDYFMFHIDAKTLELRNVEPSTYIPHYLNSDIQYIVLSEAQRAEVTELALEITDSVIGTGHIADEPIYISELALTIFQDGGFDTPLSPTNKELIGHVWVPVKHDSYVNAENETVNMTLGYDIDIGLDTGRIYSFWLCEYSPVFPTTIQPGS